jgi:glycosyltransferase involved in cell wall biosynthesis
MLSERWYPTIGGGEEHISHLARELVGMGFDITLISRSLVNKGKDAPSTESHYDGKFVIHRLDPKTEFENILGRASYIPLSLARSLKDRGRYDLVHAQSFSACLGAIALKKMLGKPAVITVHGIYQDSWRDILGSKAKANLYRKIEDFVLFRDYDRIITVDQHFISVAKSHGYPLGNVRYIPNGVDIDEFKTGSERRANSFLSVGRLVPQKGLEYLLRASAILKEKDVDHEIVLVGEGPLQKDLEKLARKLGISGTTRFLGRLPREELLEEYGNAGVFVLPSVWEGLPLTLLEAWAAGLPVLATRVGGIPDVCVHLDNSVLAEPKNPEALANGMRLLLEDRVLAKRISENGRQLVNERYSWKKVAEKTLQVYNEIV